MKRFSALLALALASALAGCGGSGNGYNLLTAGDSLSDTGTYGFRFTVQGTESAPNLVWTELVAAAVTVAAPCPRYRVGADGKVTANASATQCNGYAVGGAQINLSDQTSPGGDATPMSVLQQIRDMARERNTVLARELILIGGGGNDAATVFGLWLQWQSETDPAKSATLLAAWKALMTEVLGAARVNAAGTPQALSALGPEYMAALADNLVATMRTELFSNNAKRVVVANVPDIAQTPRMKAVLSPLKQLADQTAYVTANTYASTLVTQFNDRLSAQLAGESRAGIFDLRASLNAWVNQPPATLTEVNTPACPQTGTSQGIPTYTLSSCSAASLAAIAGGRAANWWESYLFSDDFHPTPRGHQMAADIVVREVLRDRGWR